MAPRKEDTKKLKIDDGATAVLEYLRQQNRPYSATDVSSNLHNKVTKSSAAKHLKDLHDRKQIESRISGKQVVYHAVQPEILHNDQDDLKDFEENLSQLRDSVQTLKTKERSLKTELASLMNFQSVDDLHSKIEALKTQKTVVLELSERLKSTNVKPVSEKERQELEKMLKLFQNQHRKRQRMTREMWMQVSDIYSNNVEEDEVVTKEQLWLDHIGGDGDIPA